MPQWSSLLKLGTCLGVALPWTLLSVDASADGVAQPAAQALFEDGRQLMLEERYREACEKFAASHNLEAAIGTLLNLALCHEQIGMLATAYVEYNNAFALSLRLNDSARGTVAQRQLAALEPRLSKIIIQVTEPPATPSFWIKLDETPLDQGALGVPLPVDLGQHTIAAGAEGKQSMRLIVSIDHEATMITTEIPSLVDSTKEPADVEAAAQASVPNSKLKVLPAFVSPSWDRENGDEPMASPQPLLWSAAGASFGIATVGLLLGAYFGLDAFSEWSERDRHCSAGSCDSEASNAADRARASARLSNILFAVGTAGAGAGLYCVLRASSAGEAAPRSQQAPATRITETMLLTGGVF